MAISKDSIFKLLEVDSDLHSDAAQPVGTCHGLTEVLPHPRALGM